MGVMPNIQWNQMNLKYFCSNIKQIWNIKKYKVDKNNLNNLKK